MLFKELHLQGIKSGNINLAFRRWKKASVKTGTLVKTSIGLVKIGDIEIVDENDISEEEATKAGFKNKQQLLQSFPSDPSASIFKISVCYHSEDPRIELREQSDLSDEDYIKLKEKLQRLDQFSKRGDWTQAVLLTIQDHPQLHATGIAKITGFEKEWLKLNIRKLKNLGLTISHPVGYEISPRGKLLIEKLTGKS
ncbi:hypothetical protein C1631_008490 [Chryseobacterium phosphatilyticum]|uniref:ASCH domain-containing protein n=1 Tax=Chryseobacterium phosphatilyticum TaxID=475075 RepID=A0A316XF61_9FLAO|nr:hypothetical protein [Chryseobacterium phosphatilyticum]PWN70028.1 hypothetical protein C1631_008490 [Chryseobacterium phosphatilyticum]